MSLRWRLIIFGLVAATIAGCGDDPVGQDRPTYVISAKHKGQRSTTAGNLITTAMRQVHKLDVVLYPVDFLNEQKAAVFKPGMTAEEKQKVLDYYPDLFMDNFLTGTMKGRDIKAFVRERAAYKYQLDVEPAGIVYSVGFNAGIETTGNGNFMFDWNSELEDNRYYRVAVSEMMYQDLGTCFPCYLWGDNMNFRLNLTGDIISAKKALAEFLDGSYAWPWLNQIRARVFRAKRVNENARPAAVYEIQGEKHISPLHNHRVITRGVVTALGVNLWYPGGMDLYIQDQQGDGNPATSDGVHVYLEKETELLSIGDLIEVTGVVYEQMSEGSYTSRTSIREVSDVNVLKRGVQLPEPVRLGKGGRKIPTEKISSYIGSINEKSFLKLSDAFDFYESLEGMRVSVRDIKVTGFRGGNEDHESSNDRARGYLNIHFLADAAFDDHPQMTTDGKGIFADISKRDWNPEIMQIATNHLSLGIDPTYVFNVGDRIPGEFTGVLGFERNIFGDGHYSLVLTSPEAFAPVYRFLEQKCEGIKQKMIADGFLDTLTPEEKKAIDEDQCSELRSHEQTFLGSARNLAKLPYYAQLKKTVPLRLRQPKNMTLKATDDHLTVASFNVENLAGNEPRRIAILARSIVENLKCPDIVSLVEIQDDNGTDFTQGSAAQGTLDQLVSLIEVEKDAKEEPLEMAIDARGLKLADVVSTTELGAYSAKPDALDVLGVSDQHHSVEEVALDSFIHCDSAYGIVNIDPLENAEGGKPGGNIRVAFIYKKDKISFRRRELPSPRTDTVVNRNGDLNYNPGRIYPNHPAFAGSRRSTIAQFSYKGESIYFIGNHFNSKLGDRSPWHNEQPVIFKSERRRIPMAEVIREYSQRILMADPKANIFVVGDFNAFMEEASMRVLKGKILVSLTQEMLPMSDRYTTNHNGNSQSLDYIFVNKEMMNKCPEVRVIHMNSDFMGRIADHDPVLARFCF
ncbi:MAG: hypothetical protein HRT45_02445 [Bdellovibrionales bacterium]|nr:hypothetical protein [Bdellovibrionales bacterium]